MEILLKGNKEAVSETVSKSFLFNNYIWYKTLEQGIKDLKTGFIKHKNSFFPFAYKKRISFYLFYFSAFTTPYRFEKDMDFKQFSEKFKNVLFMELVDFENRLNLSSDFIRIDTFYHYIDLEKDIGYINRSYKKSLREQIRQAERKGVVFRKMKKKDLNEFYSIYQKLSIQKFGRKPYSLNFMQSIFENLIPVWADAFVAEISNKIATGVICLHVKKDFSLAFIQGTDPDYYNYRVSSFIFDKIIKYYKKNKFKCFSFGFTPPESKGTLFFKESFGCEKQGITIWRFVHPLYKLGKKLLKFKLISL